jgi:hypothetical protein
VRFENERVDAAIGMRRVVLMDLIDDAAPVGILKTGEAEGLVEAAVAGDAEIGTEDDSDSAADVTHVRRGCVRPGSAEESQSFVVRDRGLHAEKQQKNQENREFPEHGLEGSHSRFTPPDRLLHGASATRRL